MALPGVSPAKKNNGTVYYRSSITYKNKHISLGSYSTEHDAFLAYQSATDILGSSCQSSNYIPDSETYRKEETVLPFDKWIMLCNLRDNTIYCRNPIYLQKTRFLYYLDEDIVLKFDNDDLFYYMNHRISKRGGHLFVAEYGMQVNIMSRYGIKNFAVAGRDYKFVNGDCFDFSYRNIEIINRYHGVTRDIHKGFDRYTAKIHIKGDFIIGRYSTEAEAAIAYNKAAALLKRKGNVKNFPENYIDSLDDISYAKIYNTVRISPKIREFVN